VGVVLGFSFTPIFLWHVSFSFFSMLMLIGLHKSFMEASQRERGKDRICNVGGTCQSISCGLFSVGKSLLICRSHSFSIYFFKLLPLNYLNH
jgi:hypothetical protein